MKLSASLYSSKSESIIELVNALEPFGIDLWHIDSIENLNVFEDITKITEISTTGIDLHIITKDPKPYIEKLNTISVERVSFQIEELSSEFVIPKINHTKVGLAIQISNENLEQRIKQYENDIDFVLLMMTTPGVSGGRFHKENFSTIHRIVQKFPAISWCVDGGVTHEVSYILRLIGVDSIVVGSYLTGHENMARAIMNIQSRKVRSDFKVSDFMMNLDELPIVRLNDSVSEMLAIMDRGKLGATFVLDDGNRLAGIISNADIRKVLLSQQFDYNMGLTKFINSNPKKIKNSSSTTEMIEFLDSIKFPILVLPLVDENEQLKGAISFHKLLKED